MRKSKNFKVNRSSAGSGKTYILSLNFIALALIGSVKYYTEYYRKILAITFTNKAAAEMKERVLDYLEVLSQGKNKDGVLDWLLSEIELSKHQIIHHSKKVKSSILHNYADLRISTIDKFTYTIVRTFSKDLGLSHNFELELDNSKIIEPIVANLISKISKNGGDLSDALVNFALHKLDDGKSSNIEHDLESFSENLFKEQAIPFLYSNSLNVSDCLKLKDEFVSKKSKISLQMKKLSNEVIFFLNKYQFTRDHFIRGTYYDHFTKNLQSEKSKKWTPSIGLQKNINEDIWYSKSKSSDIKKLVNSHKNQLTQFYIDLQNLISEFNTNNLLLSNIYSIAVLNELLNELNDFKKEQNIEQISIFNKKINEIIVNQPSNYIYERVGEKYNHFLIDEFQDTSILQWQNLLPLITDAVDYGTCFIVGDGKQSIYRWRGGEVEQFLNIPKIYKGENLSLSKEWENKLEYHFFNNIGDNQNYRSRKKIIDFNNQFYNTLKNRLSKNLLPIYSNCTQKMDFADDGGYVHVELVNDEDCGFKQNILNKIFNEIKKITTKNNYQYNDISILCNSRKRVSLVTDFLTEKGLSVVSNDGLLINSSQKVRLVIDVISYLVNINDNVSKLSIINYLQKNNPKFENLHSIFSKINSDFEKILLEYNIIINRHEIIVLQLYELVENIYKIFRVKSDIYTDFFLDSVLSYSEKNGSNLFEFLKWWDKNNQKESIVIPDGVNAINVMTIHKSKGLAFNVVMIPFNWEGGKSYSEIWVNSSKQTNNILNNTLINTSKILENSAYKNEYKHEKELRFLDNLNKLYVATTRAKERLYIYSKEYPKINESFLSSGKLNSFLYHFDINNSLILGDPEENHSKKQDQSFKLFPYKSRKKINWKNIVSLKSSSYNSWDIDSQSSEKDFGRLFHLVLSKTQNLEDINEICSDLYLKGICSESNKDKLILSCNRLLSDSKMKIFFDNSWEVKNEKEILTPDGDIYIPDRLLVGNEKTIILDYKTGAPDEDHKNQITRYSNILRQMGYKNIEKFLIYTSTEKLVYQV